jgi:hypothetical protein
MFEGKKILIITKPGTEDLLSFNPCQRVNIPKIIESLQNQ